MNTAMNPKNNQFNVNREPFSKTILKTDLVGKTGLVPSSIIDIL